MCKNIHQWQQVFWHVEFGFLFPLTLQTLFFCGKIWRWPVVIFPRRHRVAASNCWKCLFGAVNLFVDPHSPVFLLFFLCFLWWYAVRNMNRHHCTSLSASMAGNNCLTVKKIDTQICAGANLRQTHQVNHGGIINYPGNAAVATACIICLTAKNARCRYVRPPTCGKPAIAPQVRQATRNGLRFVNFDHFVYD